jgi:FkbM family methyltransferase
MPQRNPNLVFDIGASNGTDTQFYLDKGFDVIAVEADPVMYGQTAVNFAAPIREGRLEMLHRAAFHTAGTTLEFWRDERHQKMSSLRGPRNKGRANRLTRYEVTSIDYSSLAAIRGIPHYCKIDIEGGEVSFLKSIRSLGEAPRYLSAEAHRFAPIEELHRIGYPHFMLVDQKAVGGFPVPEPPLEGRFAVKPKRKQGSGSFGRELPGTWVDFKTVTEIFDMIVKLKSHRTVLTTRYDCHVWTGQSD